MIDLATLCAPHACHWWGMDYHITPCLGTKLLGDGQQVIGLQPLNTRPDYYIVRVDSTWLLDNWAEGDLLSDHLEEIYAAIEEEYGCVYEEEEEDADNFSGWPALDLDAGVGWFFLAGEEGMPCPQADGNTREHP